MKKKSKASIERNDNKKNLDLINELCQDKSI